MTRTRERLEPIRSNQGRDPLEARQQALERRLEDGYRRIEQALAAGEDVAEWEQFWIRLLREYEAICDDLRQAA
ncbi:MAG TPA: hypothetical protein VIL01_08010 [Thermomicrobiales bacterium]